MKINDDLDVDLEQAPPLPTRRAGRRSLIAIIY